MKRVEKVEAWTMQDGEHLLRCLRIVVQEGCKSAGAVIWYKPDLMGFEVCNEDHAASLEEQFLKENE